jgi:inhibitor of KinA sporulation pathway (predicted exonuclease)
LTSEIAHTPSVFKLLSLLIFWVTFWPFILFKILAQICKIVSHVSIFLCDKTNHNKIYDDFFIFLTRQMVKHNLKVNYDNNLEMDRVLKNKANKKTSNLIP